MHEILTVQLGTQANYVATHFWNTQEKYFTYGSEEVSPVDHDVHFRAGVATNGAETYSPRTLVYDLKENFGALRKTEGEYVEQRDQTGAVWSNTSTIQTQPQIPSHPYIQSLSSEEGPTASHLQTQPPRYFTDLAHTYFHPRSILPLPRSVIPTASHLNPLKTFQAGAELYRDLDKLETEDGDLFERDVRWWIEECDNLQGVQVITGIDDAWGGFAAEWIERWRDEVGGGKGVWVWGVERAYQQEERTREAKLLSLVNSTHALAALSNHASLYIPLTSSPLRRPAYLTYDPSSAWQASALQATAIESAAFSSRLRPSSDSRRGLLQDMVEVTNSGGNRRIAKLEMSIKDSAGEMVNGHGGAEETASGHGAGDRRMANGHSTSGDSKENFNPLDIDMFPRNTETPRGTTANSNEHVFGRIEVARGRWGLDDRKTEGEDRWDGPIVERYNSPLTFPQLTSYPSIFGVNPSHELAVHTALTTSSAVAAQVRRMEEATRRYISVDEREAMSDSLKTLCEEYEEGWESGSDEGDDD